ncbi:MAG: ABC transporter substrate-binding protein [Nocardioides sp.]|uniref:ABC transporter substrate-binding protein n=1 Tax=Nocardioides sp. TaxID=35761 RepID=UPI0039E47E04
MALTGVAGCGSSDSDDSADDGSSTVPTALASYFPGTKASGTAVKVGLVSDEGGGAVSNSNYNDAGEAAAKYANDELGGLAGHPIEIVRCGTKSDATGATACANQMVEEKVAVVVSTANGFGDTIVPIVTGAGIPYVSASGNSAAEQTSDGTYMWGGGFAATLKGFAEYAKSEGWKSVTVFPVDVPAAAGAVKAVGDPFFEAAGVELNITAIPAGVADATPQVTEGLAGDPDGLAVVNSETGCTTTLKAITVVAPDIPTMVNASCLNSGTAEALGSAFDGVKVMTNSSTSTDDEESALYRQVMEKYAPKADATGFTVTGYQSVLGLVRAVTLGGLSGDVTSDAIKAAITAAKDVPMPAATGITFTCDGTALPALPSDCTAAGLLLTVKDGKGTDPQVVE